MKKNYQTKTAPVVTAAEVAVPERVTIAMGELAEAVEEGLLAFAVATGLQVMHTIMNEDVTAVCGPKGRHDAGRTAVRHGSEAGSVTLGGRRIPVRWPRVRATDGSGEVPVASYELFSSTEILGRMALERMLAKLSTRRYGSGLEPVGVAVDKVSSSTSTADEFLSLVEAMIRPMLPPL